ncbi:hypothetical protein FLCH110379_03240 [Flavobacterium chungbukense]|uniref:Uncharacterized protein n=1 Tax=Flavobacterium chungbukense TaxID=877464 RepID=A0ABP7YLL4_9FLAO
MEVEMGSCKYQTDVCEIQIRIKNINYNINYNINKNSIALILILCPPERSRRTRKVERTVWI